MSKGYTGREFIVNLGDGADPEVFTAVAAMKSNSISFSEASVDTTTKDDAGARTLLDGSILKSCSVSGSGLFIDDASMKTMFDLYNTGTHPNLEIEVAPSATAGGYTFSGAFRITSLEYTGDFDGEMQYSITLESDGVITAA